MTKYSIFLLILFTSLSFGEVKERDVYFSFSRLLTGKNQTISIIADNLYNQLAPNIEGISENKFKSTVIRMDWEPAYRELALLVKGSYSPEVIKAALQFYSKNENYLLLSKKNLNKISKQQAIELNKFFQTTEGKIFSRSKLDWTNEIATVFTGYARSNFKLFVAQLEDAGMRPKTSSKAKRIEEK